MPKTPKGQIRDVWDDAALHQAIGKFVFQFSQLEFAVRHLLSDLLELTPTQFHIITAPYDFSVLSRVTCEFICDLPEAQTDKEFTEGVRSMFKKCAAINDARVRIVHGTWEDSGASHVSRTTLKPRAYFQSKEEIA